MPSRNRQTQSRRDLINQGVINGRIRRRRPPSPFNPPFPDPTRMYRLPENDTVIPTVRRRFIGDRGSPLPDRQDFFDPEEAAATNYPSGSYDMITRPHLRAQLLAASSAEADRQFLEMRHEWEEELGLPWSPVVPSAPDLSNNASTSSGFNWNYDNYYGPRASTPLDSPVFNDTASGFDPMRTPVSVHSANFGYTARSGSSIGTMLGLDDQVGSPTDSFRPINDTSRASDNSTFYANSNTSRSVIFDPNRSNASLNSRLRNEAAEDAERARRQIRILHRPNYASNLFY